MRRHRHRGNYTIDYNITIYILQYTIYDICFSERALFFNAQLVGVWYILHINVGKCIDIQNNKKGTA